MRANVSEIGGSEHFGVRPTLIVERYLNKITALTFSVLKYSLEFSLELFCKDSFTVAMLILFSKYQFRQRLNGRYENIL